MKIGELSKLTGASVKAIRLYEAMGLLGKIARSGTYRAYSDKNRWQVQVIRQAQSLGFKLAELAPILQAHHAELDWSQLLVHIGRKRADLQQEMQRLRDRDQQLVQIYQEILSCTQMPFVP